MKKNKPSKKKVNPSTRSEQSPENPESMAIDEIQRLCEALIEDIALLERRLPELDILIPETTRRQKAIQLLQYVVSSGKAILILSDSRLSLSMPLTDERKESLLQQLSQARFCTWGFLTILQHTANSPWEKIDKYLIHALEKSRTDLQVSEDTLVFYFLDKLDIIQGDDRKNKYWELGKKYLEKNVFKKVYEGKEPPEVKIIIESLKRAYKRLDSKEQSIFSVHGFDIKEEQIPPQDSALLNAISKGNPSEHIELATKREQARKLREAINLLPPKQKDVIQLGYYDGLTLEAVGDRLGIKKQTVNEHEKAALKRLKSILNK
jgi:RNA polymerase sigma factor (sigma-70 family)